MVWGFGFSGALSCGLFPATVDDEELSVSATVIFGRDGNFREGKHLIALECDGGFLPALACISCVSLGG